MARKSIMYQRSSRNVAVDAEKRRALIEQETANYKRVAFNPAVPKVSSTLAPGVSISHHIAAADDSFLCHAHVALWCLFWVSVS